MIATNTKDKSSFQRMAFALALLSAALLILAVILPILFNGDQGTPPTPSFEFADPSLSTNPEADEEYMALDRTVYYRRMSGYEVTVPIQEENLSSQDAELVLLWRLVRAAMKGDNEAYDACFATEYIQAGGGTASFTKQKLYDITITFYEGVEQPLPAGYSTVRFYGLTYKIKDNNGSLRSDMGSDAVKEQFFLVVRDAEERAFAYDVRTNE